MWSIILKLIGLNDLIKELSSTVKIVSVCVTILSVLIGTLMFSKCSPENDGKSKQSKEKVSKKKPKSSCKEILIGSVCKSKQGCVWNRSTQKCVIFLEKPKNNDCDKFDNGSYYDCIMADVEGGHCEWKRDSMDCVYVEKK